MIRSCSIIVETIVRELLIRCTVVKMVFVSTLSPHLSLPLLPPAPSLSLPIFFSVTDAFKKMFQQKFKEREKAYEKQVTEWGCL